MTLRHLAAVLALALGTMLAGCSDDQPSKDADAERSPTGTEASSATLGATVVQAVTPDHLDPVCPGGRFTDADDVLGTLPAKYAGQAERIISYSCDDLIDQVVWAELPDAEAAASLPAEAGGSAVFVAGTTVLAVAERLVDEAGLDATAYFEALSEACGCGSYDVTSGP